MCVNNGRKKCEIIENYEENLVINKKTEALGFATVTRKELNLGMTFLCCDMSYQNLKFTCSRFFF